MPHEYDREVHTFPADLGGGHSTQETSRTDPLQHGLTVSHLPGAANIGGIPNGTHSVHIRVPGLHEDSTGSQTPFYHTYSLIHPVMSGEATYIQSPRIADSGHRQHPSEALRAMIEHYHTGSVPAHALMDAIEEEYGELAKGAATHRNTRL